MTPRRRWRFPRLPSTHLVGVAAVALLVIGVVVSAVAPPVATVQPRRKTSVTIGASPRAAGHAARRASPVSAVGLARARAVARSFIGSYLSVAYGRAPAGSLTAATLALRAELASGRAWVTPAERERHPRVMSVEAVGEAPGFVIATAVVSDGGITTYLLRITVQQGPDGWRVSDVVDG
jgi:hypothetical protein